MGKYRDDIDWKQLELEYVTTVKSYREIADEFSVSRNSVSLYGHDHQWPEKRRKYCENVVAKAINKSENQAAGKLAKLISASDKAADVIEKALSDDNQFRRYIVTERNEEGAESTAEYIFDKTDTRALRDVVACLKDLTGIMRNLNNIPTAAEDQAMAIQRERLEIEKKKAESGDAKDNTIIVTFGDGDGS